MFGKKKEANMMVMFSIVKNFMITSRIMYSLKFTYPIVIRSNIVYK